MHLLLDMGNVINGSGHWTPHMVADHQVRIAQQLTHMAELACNISLEIIVPGVAAHDIAVSPLFEKMSFLQRWFAQANRN